MKIEFELDYPKDIDWLGQMIENEYAKTLKRAAAGQLKAIGRQYALDDAVVSGKTFASFEISDLERKADRLEIEITPRGDHAHVVEVLEHGASYRRLPSREAIDNITVWIKRRGLDRGLNAKQTRRLAFAISKNLKDYGLEHRDLVAKATASYRGHIIRMFEAATRRITDKINRKLAS